MIRHVLAVALLLAGSSCLHAQAANEYRAHSRPVAWVSDNPFRLYLVRNGDTIPGPVRGISVFRESWMPTPNGFDVVRSTVDVGLSTRVSSDTMNVTRRGKVLTINGRTDYNEGEWDALLRLPEVPLTVGLEWSDTITHTTNGPRGPGVYTVRRSYRVGRQLGSSDSVRLEVQIKGDIEFDLSMWTDSSAGVYRWFELEGPVEETFVFDPVAGQLQSRTWSMILTGIGGDQSGGVSDTVVAGLRSQNRRYWIPDDRAAALMSSLPGPDTSVSVRADQTTLFIHTFGREDGRVVEGVKHPDGQIAKAEAALVDGRPIRWTFTLVQPDADQRSVVYDAKDGGLVAEQERLVPPTPHWGVAEYEMLGTLLPSLQVLSAPQALPFSIYRPTAKRWDRVNVSSRSYDRFSLFMLSHEAGGQTALVVNSAGILLYEEVANADGTRRVRIPTTQDRQAELQKVLEVLQPGRLNPR